jgi:hypothetical protein
MPERAIGDSMSYHIGTIDKSGNFQSDTLFNDPEFSTFSTLKKAQAEIKTQIEFWQSEGDPIDDTWAIADDEYRIVERAGGAA